MTDRKPVTKLDEHGVPHCTGRRCPHRTPKERCSITGENLGSVCEPAVRELVVKLDTAIAEATKGLAAAENIQAALERAVANG